MVYFLANGGAAGLTTANNVLRNSLSDLAPFRTFITNLSSSIGGGGASGTAKGLNSVSAFNNIWYGQYFAVQEKNFGCGYVNFLINTFITELDGSPASVAFGVTPSNSAFQSQNAKRLCYGSQIVQGIVSLI